MPDVVTCLLTNNGKLLILKRSNNVSTYKGQWGGVAGFVEPDEQPLDTAFKEIKEEVGLDRGDVTLQQKGKPLIFDDIYEGKTYHWIIHPFVFKVQKKEKIQIDWEHSELLWIPPRNLPRYHTVPHLSKLVNQLLKE